MEAWVGSSFCNRHLHFLAYLPENQFFIEFIYNFRAFKNCLLDIFTGLGQGVSNFEDWEWQILIKQVIMSTTPFTEEKTYWNNRKSLIWLELSSQSAPLSKHFKSPGSISVKFQSFFYICRLKSNDISYCRIQIFKHVSEILPIKTPLFPSFFLW